MIDCIDCTCHYRLQAWITRQQLLTYSCDACPFGHYYSLFVPPYSFTERSKVTNMYVHVVKYSTKRGGRPYVQVACLFFKRRLSILKLIQLLHRLGKEYYRMHHQSKEENSYVIDVESGAELARLMDRDVKYTEAMGSLLPPDLDGSNLHDILDIACGPGGWAMDVGFAYRHIKVIGIDTSRTMIDYARALASVRRLSNVYFQVMDATQPLQFPESSFDMVNARTIIGFLLKEQWPSLIQECIRITRPGGVIRLSECDEVARTNSEAFEQMNRLVMRAFSLTGRSLSSDGENLGITS